MNKLITVLLAFMILALISGLGTAAEIFVQPGSSIQAAVNNAASGDIITVKPGTYTENIKITKGNLTIRSESGNPDNTILQAKSTGANAFLLQGNNIKITGFKIIGASRSSYAGINLSSCSNCTIENNKLSNNSRGIYLLRSNRNTVSKNNAANSGEFGIALQGSTGNILSENTASGNQRGVYFGTSDDNILSSNSVQSNSVYGIFICGLSDRNRIYNNYFNNTNMTIRNGVGNSYSTAKTAGTNIVGGPYVGGNFWGKPDGKGFSQTAVDKDGDGISDSAYKNITGSINSDNLPLVVASKSESPVANFSSNVTSGTAPLNVSFNDTSTGTPTAWNWSFGDGTANSTVKNPTHNYSIAGNYTVNYTVILTVSNSAGNNTTTKSNYIIVSAAVQKPVANFTSNVISGTEPLNVSFNDTSTGTPTAWNWSFGDGTTNSTVKSPTHNYSTAGNYTVSLTVSNAAGNNTTTKTSYIKVAAAVQKPVANFTSNVTSGTTPLNVAFTDNSTGSPSAWNWSFGDGTTNSTQQNPTHNYSTAGNYTVSLTVNNSAGSNTTTKSNYIKVTANTTNTTQKPASSFSSNVTSGIAPLNVAFTDTSAGTPTAWNWNFGDGTTNSTVKNPTHNYSAKGNYTVILTVSNSAGSNTTTKSNYINVTANNTTNVTKPVVSFWASRTSGTAPLTLGFTDASTGSPTSWNWSFGDGTYSTLQSPRHTYSKAGAYSITLNASNAAGTGTKTRANYIKIT